MAGVIVSVTALAVAAPAEAVCAVAMVLPHNPTPAPTPRLTALLSLWGTFVLVLTLHRFTTFVDIENRLLLFLTS